MLNTGPGLPARLTEENHEDQDQIQDPTSCIGHPVAGVEDPLPMPRLAVRRKPEPRWASQMPISTSRRGLPSAKPSEGSVQRGERPQRDRLLAILPHRATAH